MKNRKASDLCPLCGGRKEAGTIMFSADVGAGVVVVRHVRTTVCAQCGEEWIDDKTARALEKVAEEARAKRLQVEVTTLIGGHSQKRIIHG